MPLNLPTSRNTTYGANTPIDPADLNDLQDQIIAIGSPTFRRPACEGQLIGGAAMGAGGTAYVQLTGAGHVVQFGARGRVGSRLSQVKAIVHPQAAGSLKLELFRYEANVGEVQVGATANTVGTGVQELIVACAEDLVLGQYRVWRAVVTRLGGAANLVVEFEESYIPTP